MVIEKVIAATEVKDKNPEQHQYMEQQFGDAIEYVSHVDFKTLLFLGSMVHLLALN